MCYVKTFFLFSYILFCRSDTISPHDTVKHVEDILSILMMYSMSKYDNPELRNHHFSRTPPSYSTIPVVYP